MLPFVVDMDTLFEQFVAAWLREHLPSQLRLRAQERISVSGEGSVSFRVDPSIEQRTDKQSLAVLDTKYKVGDKIAPEDVAQVVAYAELKDTTRSLLVYPRTVRFPFDASVGHIQVRTIAFPLDADLETAGQALLVQGTGDWLRDRLVCW
jgi:5-methylcytosine-specific restriction enzyme subunit McrC